MAEIPHRTCKCGSEVIVAFETSAPSKPLVLDVMAPTFVVLPSAEWKRKAGEKPIPACAKTVNVFQPHDCQHVLAGSPKLVKRKKR